MRAILIQSELLNHFEQPGHEVVKVRSDHSTMTPSTVRRQSVRDLFDEYSIERPPGLVPDKTDDDGRCRECLRQNNEPPEWCAMVLRIVGWTYSVTFSSRPLKISIIWNLRGIQVITTERPRERNSLPTETHLRRRKTRRAILKSRMHLPGLGLYKNTTQLVAMPEEWRYLQTSLWYQSF
jgi:hypothetical protein